MNSAFLFQAAGVFGTGILASLSPCVYPMLPITLGFLSSQSGREGGKTAVLLYAFGQSIALFALGVMAVKLGETLGFSSEEPWVRVFTGVFLIIAGIFSWKGRLPRFFDRLNGAGRILPRVDGRGPLAAFILGISSALVASPCTSPILGGVLALMASAETASQGFLLMALYAMGFTFVFLIVGLGALRLKHLPRAGMWMEKIHKLSSLILVGAGIYFLAT